MRSARVLPALLVALTALPVTAAAQSSSGDIRDEVQRQFEGSARKLVALAQAMPADTYDWRPMDGVASVAEVYMHIATYNHMYPDQNLGMEAPVASAEYGIWESEITAKEDVVRILTASMTHVRTVMSGMSSGDLDAETSLYGRDVPSWAVLLQLVTHMNEHLGQSIAYARANEVAPPWSR